MRSFRIAIFMLVFAGMASFNPAEAQFKKLRNKAKDKVEKKADEKKREKERKLDAKADKKLDDAVEGMEDGAQDAAGNIFERKAQEAMSNMMGEAEEPFDLGANATGPADAPFVTYRSVTTMKFPGMDEMPDMFKSFMSVNEVHHLHDGRHRTDSRGNSNVADARGKRFINIMHASEEYSIRTFEEMAIMLSGLDNQSSQEGDDVEQDDVPTTTGMKATVTETGNTMMVNNVLAGQRIMVLEGDYEAESGSGTTDGKFYFVMDTWVSETIGGHKTVNDIMMEIARAMGAAFGGSSNPFGGFLAMMQQNPEMGEQMNDALAELRKMQGGLAVKSDTYIVTGPKDSPLDLDKVLTGELGTQVTQGPVTSQETMLIVQSIIGDLSLEPFSLGLLDAPTTYTEIQYQDPFANGGMPGIMGGMPGQ